MILRIGTCHIDGGRRRIVRDGVERHLPRKAFDLLLTLLDERPNVVTKDELTRRVWPDTFVSDANLAVLVGDIRAALGDAPRRPSIIRTHHGVGYSFIGEIDELMPPAAAGLAPPTFTLRAGRRRFLLHPGTVTVGRDEGCDVMLPHQSVSRLHARLTVGVGEVKVDDAGSKNGTRLDGVRITAPARAGDNQSLMFGSIETTLHRLRPPDGSTITASEQD